MASRLTVAKLFAEIGQPVSQLEIPIHEQAPKLDSLECIKTTAKATESTEEDFIAIRKSIRAGKLSKLLKEVRASNC